MMTVKTVCIDVALLISHKNEKVSLFSGDQWKCFRKSSLSPIFKWKLALNFFPMMTVKTACVEVALLLSHKDEKTSLFSEDKLKSVRKSSLTPVFKWNSALKLFPMMFVKTVCLEVAHLISHKDEIFSLPSEDQLKSVRKISLTPVFKWKSALKLFPMVSVKTVCIEVALLISHKEEKSSLLKSKEEKSSLFSVDQLKSVRKCSLIAVFKSKISTKIFSSDDCENCLFGGSSPF